MTNVILNRLQLKASLIAVIGASYLSSSALASDSTSVDAESINYSFDRESPPFAAAGLVRFLEDRSEIGVAATPSTTESVATSTLIAQESASTDNSATEKVAEGSPVDRMTFEELKASSPQKDAPTAPITLAPLVTPNTKTAGVGTGAIPQDMVAGRLPQPISLPTGTTRANPPLMASKVWVPGGFYHQPLYWENPMLERHGHQTCPALQPAISGVRFYGTFLVLPYLATLRDPLADVHTLGSYRPGSPAPALRYRAHYDPRALRNQVIMSGAATAISAP